MQLRRREIDSYYNGLTFLVCTLHFEASPFDSHSPTCAVVLPLEFQDMVFSLHYISPRGSHHKPTVLSRESIGINISLVGSWVEACLGRGRGGGGGGGS